MCQAFSLSGTTSTVTAFLEGELPSFGVQSRCITTSSAGGVTGCGWCTTDGPSVFSVETRSAWRAQVPSPTGTPEVVVSTAAEDTTCGAAPLLAPSCWPCVVLTSAPAVTTAAAAASASSLEDQPEAFFTLLVVVSRVNCARLAPLSSTILPDVVPGASASSSQGLPLCDTRGRKSHGRASSRRSRSACHRCSSSMRFSVRAWMTSSSKIRCQPQSNFKQFAQIPVVRSTQVALVWCGSIASDPLATHDPNSVAYQPRNGRQLGKKDDSESVFNAVAQSSALARKRVVTVFHYLRSPASCQGRFIR